MAGEDEYPITTCIENSGFLYMSSSTCIPFSFFLCMLPPPVMMVQNRRSGCTNTAGRSGAETLDVASCARELIMSFFERGNWVTRPWFSL